MGKPKFTFVDLFAGIGGFHAALSGMGGKCVYAVEIDTAAARVYKNNWGLDPLGDITLDANDSQVRVPKHDVLCAGFPCQPFSKSGAQRGMEETRGTLYWNILRIIEERRPSIVLLENVRNLTGPRHRHEWQVIIETLRDVGYRVSETPAIFSPHLLPPERGGRPQVRERVFISATRVDNKSLFTLEAEPVVSPKPVGGWEPQMWGLDDFLLTLSEERALGARYSLSESETLWIDAWNEFVELMWEEREGRRLPGFPIWVDDWVTRNRVDHAFLSSLPDWKRNYVTKNVEFYTEHRQVLDKWTTRWGVKTSRFPPSRRKFEWQAQDTPSLWNTVMHLRPSGIRAKAPTYLPALVAITQTSIIGPRRRRLTPREAARLQGLPEWFDFSGQTDATTYRQLGNGVSVGAVWHVLKQHAIRDEDALKVTNPSLLRAILSAPCSPDEALT